ncbi:MAG: dihydrolipoamide acetyltransferase, partial [Myxococcales bacterium]|nr:dihydrolipoamide acetyltransferase [Myxococcales bacterium]
GLKEDVFRSKARLLLLRETVLHGMVSGARGILYHVNELGGEYVIESITYFLDGSKIFSRADTSGELARKKEIKFFDGGLPAGNHQVSANVVLRGNGFGIFSYLNQYTLKVQGSYSFIAQEGKVTRLRIIIYERGGLRQDFTDRPYFRYEVQTDRNLPTDE